MIAALFEENRALRDALQGTVALVKEYREQINRVETFLERGAPKYVPSWVRVDIFGAPR